MNPLENQILPKVPPEFDVSSFNQVGQDITGLELPNALTAPYTIVRERQGLGSSYTDLRVQPFQLRRDYEQAVTRISVRIADAVRSSRRILDLQENWDEEGSPGYAFETWERATQFVLQTAIMYRKFNGVWISPPKITAGPDGSIDVRWKTSIRSVLINFPSSEAETVQFFGSDGDVETIKGTLDLTSPNQWILVWLMR